MLFHLWPRETGKNIYTKQFNQPLLNIIIQIIWPFLHFSDAVNRLPAQSNISWLKLPK